MASRPHSESWQTEVQSHLPEYTSEFAGTCFLVFCVVLAVAWMFAPSSVLVRLLPSVSLRLFLTGLILGGAGSFVAITPIGRISGAHLNPAMSLGFFADGRMHAQDLAGYIVAQMSGASVGAWVGRLIAGPIAYAVHDALNQPGQHASAVMAVVAEFASTFALAFVVFLMVSRKSLMRGTPLAGVFVVAVIVWLDGNFSGASLNPARSFGPALVTGEWREFWVYCLGPCSGAIVAGLLHRFGTPLEAETGKLFHDIHYRSIFSGRSDADANEHVRRHAAVRWPDRPPVHRKRNSETDGRAA